MKSFKIIVTQTVEVKLDESKFDESFMAEFRGSFYPFYDIEDHAKHIGQLEARGITYLQVDKKEFIEGYGPANEMGIAATIIDSEIDLEFDQ